MTDRRHIDREFERELETLREQVLLMGARVEEMLGLAIRAFSNRDVVLAENTIGSDRHIDQLELAIDELCLRILARRQPVASDLRLVTTAMKLVTDLERIADLCVNICERVVELARDSTLPVHTPILKIAEIAQGMVHDSLDAFVAGDAIKAKEVVQRDDAVDAYYAQLFPELVASMMSDPNTVVRSTRLLSLAKYIERIADHATNIAEDVVYLVEGEIIRHRPEARGDD
jgi:phosphate transport system protein